MSETMNAEELRARLAQLDENALPAELLGVPGRWRLTDVSVCDVEFRGESAEGLIVRAYHYLATVDAYGTMRPARWFVSVDLWEGDERVGYDQASAEDLDAACARLRAQLCGLVRIHRLLGLSDGASS